MISLNKATANQDQLTAWVFDDYEEQEQDVIEGLKEVGINSVIGETDIDAIIDPVQELESGKLRAPNLIIIDQHWRTSLVSLEVLGCPEILIESPRLVGYALGRYFRKMSAFDETKIVMTTLFDGAFDERAARLANTFCLRKGENFGERVKRIVVQGDSSYEESPVTSSDEDYVRGALKFLNSFAHELSMEDDALSLVLGGIVSGAGAKSTTAEEMLRKSRDARQRVTYLIALSVFLSQGTPLGAGWDADLRETVRHVAVRGSLEELALLKFRLENAAGGPLA